MLPAGESDKLSVFSYFTTCFTALSKCNSPEYPNIRVGSRLFHCLDLMYVPSLEGELAGSAFVYLVQMAKLLEEVLVDH